MTKASTGRAWSFTAETQRRRGEPQRKRKKRKEILMEEAEDAERETGTVPRGLLIWSGYATSSQ
jgi:hypothetical protein